MLLEYQISNFKAFNGTETIPIKPITLIYGPNSSGKSSILQSLLMLKQTTEESERPETLLIPKGNLVNLGGFREFAHQHDISRDVTFKLTFKLDARESRSAVSNSLWRLAKTSKYGFKVCFNYNKDTSSIKIDELSLYIGDEPNHVISFAPEYLELTPQMMRRMSYTSQTAGVGSGHTVLKLKKINSQHVFWRSVWDSFRLWAEGKALEQIKDRIESLQSRLKLLPSDDNSETERNNTVRIREDFTREVETLESLAQLYNRFSFQYPRQNHTAIASVLAG